MVIEWLVEADFAHFSHPATIYSSLTYPVPPKTTVMGMLGAIAGMDDVTPLNSMRYAVCVERLDGKRQFCFNGIKEALSVLDPKKWVDPKKPFGVKERKQFYRELLITPKYRIFCDLSEVSSKESIVEAMQKGKCHYPLYLGINFCLATYELVALHGDNQERTAEDVEIDSMVPLEYDFVLEPDKQYTDIRMATTVDAQRHFGGFRDYLVELGGQKIRCNKAKVCDIGDKTIAWS